MEQRELLLRRRSPHCRCKIVRSVHPSRPLAPLPRAYTGTRHPQKDHGRTESGVRATRGKIVVESHPRRDPDCLRDSTTGAGAATTGAGVAVMMPSVDDHMTSSQQSDPDILQKPRKVHIQALLTRQNTMVNCGSGARCSSPHARAQRSRAVRELPLVPQP